MLSALSLKDNINAVHSDGFSQLLPVKPDNFLRINPSKRIYSSITHNEQSTVTLSLIIHKYSVMPYLRNFLSSLCLIRPSQWKAIFKLSLSLLPRKKCLLLNNIFLMTGALLALTSRAAKSFEMIIISRVLVGINAGVCVCVTERQCFSTVCIKYWYA